MIIIEKAEPHDADVLTSISFSAKRYWNYPEEYFDIWKDELTITPEYIEKNKVYVATEGITIGYYSIVNVETDLHLPTTILPRGSWLEHMFIEPNHIGRGIGTMFIDHLRNQHPGLVKVLSDPFAKDFYIKQGFTYITDIPSTINGRTTPYLELQEGMQY